MDLTSNKKVKSAIEEIIRKEEFIEHNLQILPGVNKYDNHMSIILKVKITGRKRNNEISELNLFCKTPVVSEVMRKEVQLNDIFARECLFYEKILKDFKKFENEKNITKGFESFVKCYASSDEDGEEFVILDDVTAGGFVMCDRYSRLDLHHAELVMKELGKLHALSFALKDQQPEVINKYKRMQDNLFPAQIGKAKALCAERLVQIGDESVQLKGLYRKKWEIIVSHCLEIAQDCVRGFQDEPYAVICHGDCWNNNMMFKYEDGVPVDIRIFDWQITRYTSPAIDLSYFLFLSTEKSLRSTHYHHLINVYYESLSKFMKTLGSDPEKLFPFSALQEQLKKNGRFGLVSAAYAFPVICNEVAYTDYMEDASGKKEDGKVGSKMDDRGRQLLTDVIIDTVDLGYL